LVATIPFLSAMTRGRLCSGAYKYSHASGAGVGYLFSKAMIICSVTGGGSDWGYKGKRMVDVDTFPLFIFMVELICLSGSGKSEGSYYPLHGRMTK